MTIQLLALIYAAGALYHFSLMMNRIRISGAPTRGRLIAWVLFVVFWPLTQLGLLVSANAEEWR